METITLTYDKYNSLAMRTLEYILSLGVFKTKAKASVKPLYNPEFVEKIKSQEGMQGVKINIEDLWK
jgi:hypothetical protein